MTSNKKETTLQAVRRHLRNGYIILTERGVVSLYGAAMREAARSSILRLAFFWPLGIF